MSGRVRTHYADDATLARLLQLEEENARLREDNRALFAALRRLTDGMHTGDDQDAPAALASASALVGHLAARYEAERRRPGS